MNFLVRLLVLVRDFPLSGSLGDLGFLSFLDLSNSFFSESLLIFGLGLFEFSDGVEGDAFNCTFLLEHSFLFLLTSIALLDFFMKSSPCGCPSESLCFELPETEVSSSLGKEKERSTIFGEKSNSLSRVDLPLAEVAELSFDHHLIIKYNIKN